MRCTIRIHVQEDDKLVHSVLAVPAIDEDVSHILELDGRIIIFAPSRAWLVRQLSKALDSLTLGEGS